MSLEDLIEGWVTQRLARGEIAESTAETNRATLRQVTRLLALRGLEDIDQAAVERLLVDRSTKPATKRLRFFTLRGFCQWLVRNEHLHRDPTSDLPAPPADEYEPRDLAPKKITFTLEACRDSREIVMALLMVQEGLRRAEVSRVLLDDVDFEREALHVRGKGGRGRVTRTVHLTAETALSIHEYLRDHPPVGSVHLIRSYRRRQHGLTPTHIGNLVTAALYKAQVKQEPHDGRTPHALRHTCAQRMADDEIRAEIIQFVLGHASVNTTKDWYLRHTPVGVAEAMEGRTYRRDLPCADDEDGRAA